MYEIVVDIDSVFNDVTCIRRYATFLDYNTRNISIPRPIYCIGIPINNVNEDVARPTVHTSRRPYFDQARSTWYTELTCSYENVYTKGRCHTARVQWSTLSANGKESVHGRDLLTPEQACTSRLEIAVAQNTSNYVYVCETTDDNGVELRSSPPFSPDTQRKLLIPITVCQYKVVVSVTLSAANATIVVAVGKAVSATCPSNYPDANATVWNTQKGPGVLAENVQYLHTHLHIERFSTRNVGEYECRAVGDPRRNILAAPTNSFLTILQMSTNNQTKPHREKYYIALL